MDDAKGLIDELLSKLSELDSKVATYQQDMLAEFTRYAHNLLKDVPEHVSKEVSRVIAESMSNFPSLHFPSHDSPESPPTSSHRRVAWDGRKSPPPILYHTSGTPKDDRRSPHEREKEFQGVFTPSYLPLLDSSDRPPHSPPVSLPPIAKILTLSLDSINDVEHNVHIQAQTQPSQDAARPGPVRCPTDATVSSVDSSGSDATRRRSALRRSSSSTRGSPRRVRFEFQGTEVLPTSSPQQASTIVLLSPDEAEVPASAVIDESPAYTGPSLLDVEGEEDMLPLPKKVSSTQALRALSRSPLDEGTVWTVVNADPEDQPPKMNGRSEAATTSSAQPTASAQSAAPPSLKSRAADLQKARELPRPLPEEAPDSPIEGLARHEDEDASEEEYLSMRPKVCKKPPPPASQSPKARSPVASDLSARLAKESGREASGLGIVRPNPNNSTSKNGKGDGNDQLPVELEEEDGLFNFDEGDENLLLIPKSKVFKHEKYITEADQDLEVEDPPTVPVSVVSSASPSVSIPKHLPDPQTSTPTSKRLLQGSIGSYKGTPLKMNVLINPKLHEEAAAMGDFNTFVGSVDGRTGFDPADLNSFRASLPRGGFSGTPRSFSERMALEEVEGEDQG